MELPGERLFEGVGIEGHTDELLAQTIVNVLPDAGLFAVADLEDLPFQPEPFGDVGGHTQKAGDVGVPVTGGGVVAFHHRRAELQHRAELFTGNRAANVLGHQRIIAENLLDRAADVFTRLHPHGAQRLAVFESQGAIPVAGKKRDRRVVDDRPQVGFTPPQ